MLFSLIRLVGRRDLQISVLFSALTLIQPNREGLEVVAASVAVVPRTKGVRKLNLQRDVAYCEKRVPALKASVARCIGQLHNRASYSGLACVAIYGVDPNNDD